MHNSIKTKHSETNPLVKEPESNKRHHVKMLQKNKKWIILVSVIIAAIALAMMYFSPSWQHSNINHKYLISQYLNAQELSQVITYDNIHFHSTYANDQFTQELLKQAQLSAPEKVKEIQFLLLLIKQSIDQTDFYMLKRNIEQLIPFLDAPIDANLDILDANINLEFDHMMGIRAELSKLNKHHCIVDSLTIAKDQNTRACGLFLLKNTKIPFTTILAIDAKQNKPIGLSVVIANLKKHRFTAIALNPTQPCKEDNTFIVNLNDDPKTFLTNFISDMTLDENNKTIMQIGNEAYVLKDECKN
ncbi:hypothetical protein [Thorsellia anophelis]|uniref:Uncharacterized protein n=1 Tax=Thorsellia anophelis DSM 18579 TaxID=1123402 RepID=A0A1I0EXQ2_9GAMM|nr:hypothetical protein [Thorsellia anophelis]SET49482.1 hypothetical protein SAMN02583745_02536 [Thorsellia anophelis DSM 18579]